ncbi:hypothetical protein B0H66DRAFT_570860 [Apodospora peruviana]|uniref:TPR repeat-containing protein n=1 Tax=Apodospora peruviana TaxID=516989 RepID=A0AAE0HTS7_9PEZI|nr:hypothetical protein B0H66DRAFT_570860 [Apodospora peruviana]
MRKENINFDQLNSFFSLPNILATRTKNRHIMMGSSSEMDHLQEMLRDGRYIDILTFSSSDLVKAVTEEFVAHLFEEEEESPTTTSDLRVVRKVVGLAAFNAFLQTNVTGPVLDDARKFEKLLGGIAAAESSSSGAGLKKLRRACFRSLDVDGVSVYPYIPNIELFCLARFVFTYPKEEGGVERVSERGEQMDEDDVSWNWLALRVHVWHYKLLTQPSLGPGSIFVKSAQWSDVPTLEQVIETKLEEVVKEVQSGGGTGEVQFLVEMANVRIMLGQDVKAREALRQATDKSGFVYALSGAMAKRTKWQEKSTSQLVVLARSAEATGSGENGGVKPEALKLNDDTLLESLEFTTEKKDDNKVDDNSILPAALRDVSPDEQPQLSALDQIILLSEATLKDAFSPADSLTSEEILPFAVRVISDTSTNWQIYTQALIVRSRIEVHRSRTVERGVLQMQAVVDQVIVDTTKTEEVETTEEKEVVDEMSTVPEIRFTEDGDEHNDKKSVENKPTSFFPATKPSETAPAQVRLRYIHVLNSPPRWHLESELAYSWAGVGSLVSALEIFKRLRLWAEVALCLAANARTEDEDGRGSGGEAKAKAVLRWRLFQRTGSSTELTAVDEVDEDDVDISDLKEADFQGPERSPPPPNAPRLFCILGDIENDPVLYERAWEISNHRFSRAQRSLGEYYLQQKDAERAREAYEKAVKVNRLSSEMWSRLGDINLRLGRFSDAAEAFGRAIAAADNIVGGDDARTWSNLGSALYSLYVERVKELKKEREEQKHQTEADVVEKVDDEESDELTQRTTTPPKRDPAALLSQALAAYKRGASIAHENWRIWDNVLTLASRLRPPAVPELLLALRNIIKIRKTEEAIDIDVLRLLLNETVLSKPNKSKNGVYEPPRGSHERAVCDILETEVVPLITTRSELWEIITRERVWRRDYPGAIDSSERAWRAAVGTAGTGLLPSAAKTTDWLEDKEAWQTVVERTDDLVAALENYGEEVPEIGAKWKSKARSAVRSVLGKAKESWEGSEEWERLQGSLEGLR